MYIQLEIINLRLIVFVSYSLHHDTMEASVPVVSLRVTPLSISAHVCVQVVLLLLLWLDACHILCEWDNEVMYISCLCIYQVLSTADEFTARVLLKNDVLAQKTLCVGSIFWLFDRLCTHHSILSSEGPLYEPSAFVGCVYYFTL